MHKKPDLPAGLLYAPIHTMASSYDRTGCKRLHHQYALKFIISFAKKAYFNHNCKKKLKILHRCLRSFLIHHIRSKIALPHTFPSSCVTSGNLQCALHSTLRHIPLFLMCNIRNKIALSPTFPSSSATSGNRKRKIDTGNLAERGVGVSNGQEKTVRDTGRER